MNLSISNNEPKQAKPLHHSGRGGIRAGAGRKSTLQHPADSIRVDTRLFPFLQWTKRNGIDDNLLEMLNKLITDKPDSVPVMPSIDLRAELTLYYSIPAKNRTRDVQKRIKDACIALGFNPENLNYDQQKAVLNWHREKSQ